MTTKPLEVTIKLWHNGAVRTAPMAKAQRQPLKHIERPMTDEQRQQATAIRQGAKQDFPPKDLLERPIPPGIPQRNHDARKHRGITRYKLGQSADVPSTVETVRLSGVGV